MILPRGSIIKFDGKPVSEHNRAQFEIGQDPIQSDRRMIDGTLRRQFIANKQTYSASWSMLPTNVTSLADSLTPDIMGGQDIIDFYENNPGDFILEINTPEGTYISKRVMFDSFNQTVVKRSPNGFNFVDISLTLKEV